jgi:uncharacterized phage-associated protein
MASAIDIAEHIIRTVKRQNGEVPTAWQLQKLTYFVQAWSFAIRDAPAFDERIEAWRDGPVCRDVYSQHRKAPYVATVQGDAKAVPADVAELIDSVCDVYGRFDGEQLVRISHAEIPWREARGSLPPGARSESEITSDSIREHYQAIGSTLRTAAYRRGLELLASMPSDEIECLFDEPEPAPNIENWLRTGEGTPWTT